MTDRELMQQALEALNRSDYLGWQLNIPIIKSLRDRLAQPEQEPVANIRIWHKNGEQHAELWNWDKGIETLPDGNYDLYTTPPQRKPLTDEECDNLWAAQLFDITDRFSARDFIRDVEAAHGIKGQA